MAGYQVGSGTPTATKTEVIGNSAGKRASIQDDTDALIDELAEALSPPKVLSEAEYSIDPGVWIAMDGWLWHCNKSQKRKMHKCPETAEICGDGIGGVFAAIEGSLWHFDRRGGSEEKCSCAMDVKLCGDAVGGVWFISDGTLWHLLMSNLRRLYDYPNDVEMAADGLGGCWILDDGTLYHCTDIYEQRHHKFPDFCRLETDGLEGVYVLTTGGVFHCNRARKTHVQDVPVDSEICTDGHGGLWCHYDGWLWNLRENGTITKKYPLPTNADIDIDGVGGIWALFNGALWHVNDLDSGTKEALAARRNMSIEELRKKPSFAKMHECKRAHKIVGACG